jgi:hypothetical protein
MSFVLFKPPGFKTGSCVSGTVSISTSITGPLAVCALRRTRFLGGAEKASRHVLVVTLVTATKAAMTNRLRQEVAAMSHSCTTYLSCLWATRKWNKSQWISDWDSFRTCRKPWENKTKCCSVRCWVIFLPSTNVCMKASNCWFRCVWRLVIFRNEMHPNWFQLQPMKDQICKITRNTKMWIRRNQKKCNRQFHFI